MAANLPSAELVFDMHAPDKQPYGTGNASFLAAGAQAGIQQLVDAFFDRMGSDPRFRTIYDMHPQDKIVSRDKLSRFLCGWLGGPKRFQEKYGPISLPAAHQHLAIAEAERDQWLTCMSETVTEQPFHADFKRYLMEQLAVPAESVHRRCKLANEGSSDEKIRS
jgi:hemoglobin